MKLNLKKIAFVALLVFILALAGPVVMNLALGTDTVGVISAAYPNPSFGSGDAGANPDFGSGFRVNPGSGGNIGPNPTFQSNNIKSDIMILQNWVS